MADRLQGQQKSTGDDAARGPSEEGDLVGGKFTPQQIQRLRAIRAARKYNRDQHPDLAARFLAATGIDPLTINAVRAWQREHGLKADGKIGPETARVAEESAPKSPVDQASGEGAQEAASGEKDAAPSSGAAAGAKPASSPASLAASGQASEADEAREAGGGAAEDETPASKTDKEDAAPVRRVPLTDAYEMLTPVLAADVLPGSDGGLEVVNQARLRIFDADGAIKSALVEGNPAVKAGLAFLSEQDANWQSHVDQVVGAFKQLLQPIAQELAVKGGAAKPAGGGAGGANATLTSAHEAPAGSGHGHGHGGHHPNASKESLAGQPKNAAANGSAGAPASSAAAGETVEQKTAELEKRIQAGQLDPEAAVGELAAYAQAHGGMTSQAIGLMDRLRNAKPGNAEAPHAAGAAGAPMLAGAGNAAHDGGKNQALGAGDQVLHDGHVVPVFPATPEGVVAAAYYELHRGDKRSIDDIMKDDSGGRTAQGAQAAHEGHVEGAKGGTNDDRAGAQKIATFTETKGKKGHRVTETSELGPIETYIAQVGVDPHAGIPWCGSFATYVYRRAGIKTPSLAFSLDVPDRLAQMAAKGEGGAYYRMTGDEHTKRKHGKKDKEYGGDFQEGKAGKEQDYDDKAIKSTSQLDIRAGDVFWQEHSAKSGHVGIIVGVHKTETEVTVVTVEGNASDQVTSKVHKITVDGSGKVTSGFKGWGRPPELGGAAAPDTGGDEPKWMKETEDRSSHQKGNDRDR